MAPSPDEYEIQQRIRLACGRGTIGLRRVEITAAMVGQHIGQFIAIEVKTPHGAIRPEQESYLQLVGRLGGVAAICRSLEDARTTLEPTAGVGRGRCLPQRRCMNCPERHCRSVREGTSKNRFFLDRKLYWPR